MTDVLTTGWPDRLLSLADWEALPEDETHDVECSEGVLVVSPKPKPRHQRAMVRLAEMLDTQLGDDLVALADVEVLLMAGPPVTVRAPDVLVTTSSVLAANPPRLQPADVLLAVEFLSQGSRRRDRVLKMSEYAEACIADYWIVDLVGQVSLSCYRLGADDAYAEVGRYGGSAELPLLGGTVRLDLDQLTI